MQSVMQRYLIRVATVAVVLLMTSQVSMADCVPLPTEQSVPTLSEWGMIAAAVVLGLGGAYRIRKHPK